MVEPPMPEELGYPREDQEISETNGIVLTRCKELWVQGNGSRVPYAGCRDAVAVGSRSQFS